MTGRERERRRRERGIKGREGEGGGGMKKEGRKEIASDVPSLPSKV